MYWLCILAIAIWWVLNLCGGKGPQIQNTMQTETPQPPPPPPIALAWQRQRQRRQVQAPPRQQEYYEQWEVIVHESWFGLERYGKAVQNELDFSAAHELAGKLNQAAMDEGYAHYVATGESVSSPVYGVRKYKVYLDEEEG
jgi:hypothetical protein